jgi:hypothetical protein
VAEALVAHRATPRRGSSAGLAPTGMPGTLLLGVQAGRLISFPISGR